MKDLRNVICSTLVLSKTLYMNKLILSAITFILSTTVFAQLSNGLTAYFPFSGDFNDISTNAITGTNNGCTLGTDRFSNSNETMFNATGTGYISFNDNSVKTALPVTISVWVKLASVSQPNIIFTSDNVYNNNYGYWLSTLTGTGQIGINYAGGLGGANSSNRRSFVTNEVLSTGVWHHIVAIIRDYSDMDVYIDCVKATGNYSGTGSSTISYSTTESRIGSNIGNNANPSGTYLDGDIDQIAIWNRSLTGLEIDTLCQQEVTLSNNEIPVKDFSLNVYPNPSSDVAHISFGTPVNAQIEVYNVLGDKVMTTTCSNKKSVTLNVDKWSKGVYIFKITREGDTRTIRFIKE